MTVYSWGLDGYGRAHICKDDNVIILSMMDGCCGKLGTLILEEQEMLAAYEVSHEETEQ